MGFFDRLFGSSLERQLEDLYAGMHGRDHARALLAGAKQRLERDPSITVAPILLQQLRAEGVTDSDYRWWWDLQPLERAVMLESDEAFMASALAQCRAEGMSNDQAVARVRRTFPRFGNPSDPGDYASSGDRPLPRELKNRVSGEAMTLGAQITPTHTSMNALVRGRIRSGTL